MEGRSGGRQARGLNARISGVATPRARQELEARGFKVAEKRLTQSSKS